MIEASMGRFTRLSLRAVEPAARAAPARCQSTTTSQVLTATRLVDSEGCLPRSRQAGQLLAIYQLLPD